MGAGRLARVGSKGKDELVKSLAQASSSSGTIPAKGLGRDLHCYLDAPSSPPSPRLPFPPFLISFAMLQCSHLPL